MKLFSKILILLVILGPRLTLARTTSYFDLIELQNKALINRLEIMQDQQKKSLEACPVVPSFNPHEPFLASELKIPSLLEAQKQQISTLVTDLRHLSQQEADCRHRAPQVKSIRSIFTLARYGNYNSSLLNRTWLKELEPACFKVRQKGILKNIDTNACFAGDRVMYEQALKQNIDPVNDPLRLSYSLLADLANTLRGGDFDMKNSFEREFKYFDPKKFLTTLALISTSGPSGLTGWLQGFEDRMLVNDLNSQKTPDKIYDNFKKFQLAKYNYIKFRDLADKYKVTLKINGQPILNWNRHNMMAAFLACTERSRFGSLTPELVYLTGVTYESKDFISHLKSHVSLSVAEENFTSDTARYQTAGELGYQLCPK